MTINKTHGSPYDRGSADAYYGRAHRPHYYRWPKPGVFTMGERIEEDQMTELEIEQYTLGYDQEDSRKDW